MEKTLKASTDIHWLQGRDTERGRLRVWDFKNHNYQYQEKKKNMINLR